MIEIIVFISNRSKTVSENCTLETSALQLFMVIFKLR